MLHSPGQGSKLLESPRPFIPKGIARTSYWLKLLL